MSPATLGPAGPVTTAMWERSAPTRARIDALPFLARLADGTLGADVFAGYLVQDGLYLEKYRRALALLATRAQDADAASMWAASVIAVAEEEQAMQHEMLSDPRLAAHAEALPASLTTRAYGDSLIAAAATSPYPVAVAAVLPCFWIYADVGARLVEAAAGIAEHPYRPWVDAYADPGFQRSAAQAIAETERCASRLDAAGREDMIEAFLDAAHFEELFWASATEQERWERPTATVRGR